MIWGKYRFVQLYKLLFQYFCPRYTAEKSVKFGAPRNTDHPELRQPLVLEIWQNVTRTVDKGTMITILTNGPLTTLSKILASDEDASSVIQVVTLICQTYFSFFSKVVRLSAKVLLNFCIYRMYLLLEGTYTLLLEIKETSSQYHQTSTLS